MKYAVLESNGKQFRVKEGDKLVVDPILYNSEDKDINEGEELKENDQISFDKICLITDGDDVTIGSPYISGANVSAKVLNPRYKGKKVIAYKYKRRQGYHRKKGHRQHHLDVEIVNING